MTAMALLDRPGLNDARFDGMLQGLERRKRCLIQSVKSLI